MVGVDVDFVRALLASGYIHGPCLELGVGLEGANNRDLIRGHGVEYYGSDVVPGPMVDFVIDLEEPLDGIQSKVARVGRFGSVLAMNVLEHTFDPIRVLDNLFGLLTAGGTCAIITPASWPLHDFPMDCWRILPSFYVTYAARRGYTLIEDTFQFVSYGPVRQFNTPDGRFAYPRPGRSSVHFTYSKVVHKLFDTFGRDMFFPTHVACGVVLRNSPAGC